VSLSNFTFSFFFPLFFSRKVLLISGRGLGAAFFFLPRRSSGEFGFTPFFFDVLAVLKQIPFRPRSFRSPDLFDRLTSWLVSAPFDFFFCEILWLLGVCSFAFYFVASDLCSLISRVSVPREFPPFCPFLFPRRTAFSVLNPRVSLSNIGAVFLFLVSSLTGLSFFFWVMYPLIGFFFFFFS